MTQPTIRAGAERGEGSQPEQGSIPGEGSIPGAGVRPGAGLRFGAVSRLGDRPAWLRALRQPVVLAAVAVVLLVVVGEVLAPGFASTETAANVLRVASFLGVIAAGQTIVILAGGEGIDLSVGAVATFAAIVVAQVSGGSDALLLPAVVAALAVCGLAGLANGVGVAVGRIPPLVMTLGMVGVVQGVVRLLSGGQPEGRAPGLLVDVVNARTVLDLRGSTWLWLAVAVLVVWLLRGTLFGRRVYAVGTNRETAYLSGVRVRVTIVLAYLASSLLAAVGGIMLLGFSETVSISLADEYMLPSIAAVVIGGTTLAGGIGGYTGTIVGAVVLTTLTSLLTALDIDPAGRQVVFGLILVALLSVYGRQRRLRQ